MLTKKKVQPQSMPFKLPCLSVSSRKPDMPATNPIAHYDYAQNMHNTMNSLPHLSSIRQRATRTRNFPGTVHDMCCLYVCCRVWDAEIGFLHIVYLLPVTYQKKYEISLEQNHLCKQFIVVIASKKNNPNKQFYRESAGRLSANRPTPFWNLIFGDVLFWMVCNCCYFQLPCLFESRIGRHVVMY